MEPWVIVYCSPWASSVAVAVVDTVDGSSHTPWVEDWSPWMEPYLHQRTNGKRKDSGVHEVRVVYGVIWPIGEYWAVFGGRR